MRLQVLNHPLTGVTVRAQECMVVPDTVQALADFVLGKLSSTLVPCSYGLDGTFLSFDVFLNITPCPPFGVDFFRGNSDEVVA